MQVRLPRPGVIAAVVTVLYGLGSTAQILTPVVWTFSESHSPVRRTVAVAAFVALPLLYTRLLWVATRRRVAARHYVDLAERVGAAGGEFSAGPAGDGTFRVTASVPRTGGLATGETAERSVA
ncbi:hypothetical protein [Actinoallomurus sp. NPDC050550]|uniref:hypothetical protein n=1 Tax=Actinoallomurus sp. NPDC050550 TaxID=3154937 RepID=UPI0033BFB9BA